MIDLTVKTLDSQNHAFSLEDDVSIFFILFGQQILILHVYDFDDVIFCIILSSVSSIDITIFNRNTLTVYFRNG